MKTNDRDNVREDEIIFIGKQGSSSESKKKTGRRGGIFIALAVAVVVVAVVAVIAAGGRGGGASDEPDETGLFEEIVEAPVDSASFMSDDDSAGAPCTERIDTTAGNVPLTLLIPHHAVPDLSVGAPEYDRNEYVLAAQAADIRADNRQILGSFVLGGEILAQGTSKQGFCAIIDGKITVGVSENTTLFDKAVESGGYFFRQYPLVDNGVPVRNDNLKKQTVRKALCSKDGKVFIVITGSELTMNDFSALLAGFGVDNAIYLVGSSSSYGWYIPENGDLVELGLDLHRPSYRNESYIRWRNEDWRKEE